MVSEGGKLVPPGPLWGGFLAGSAAGARGATCWSPGSPAAGVLPSRGWPRCWRLFFRPLEPPGLGSAPGALLPQLLCRGELTQVLCRRELVV